MRLHELIRRYDSTIHLAGVPDVEILGVREDSRQVRPGDLFVARSGTKTDGLRFISDAYARGAVAVAAESRAAVCPLPQLQIKDAAAAVSGLAHILLGEPTRQLCVLAVTGTNGKTTSTYLIRHLLAKAGIRCGLIGTVETDDGVSRIPAEHTTPDGGAAVELMARMRDHGCRACVIEVSSHALDQRRVAGVRFAAAAFTNLTGDHQDYHKGMERYADAKARLFESLDPSAAAIVNAADPASARMSRDCKARVLRFGFEPNCDYRADDVAISAAGSRFILRTPAGSAPVSMRLVGRYNIENALTAAALAAETFKLSSDQIAAGLADAVGAPGRLELAAADRPFAVLIDYAHTDDALKNVLSALRPLTEGKLRVVFGCGGDRDNTKRPRMGRVAEEIADAVYITSDNPRSEDPLKIIEQIRAGLSRPDAAVIEPDRRAAIRRAIADAQAGDVVLLAGKGHEKEQIIGSQKLHFDDVEEAKDALAGK